jgi:hypothetical protein
MRVLGRMLSKKCPRPQGDVDVPDPHLTTLANLLLQRIRQDQYPSATEMQLLESIIPQSMVSEYLDVLLEKVQADTWPSIPMMQRIIRIAEWASHSASPSPTAG